MSQIMKRYCVYGCDPLVTFVVPSHRFPHPEKQSELFDSWVSIIDKNLKESDRIKIYKNKRICDHHFAPLSKINGRRLKHYAIPSINLHRIQQNCTTFVEADHCYAPPDRVDFETDPVMDITNLAEPPRHAAFQRKGIQQNCTTFVEVDNCYSPSDEADTVMDITNLAEPSRHATIENTETQSRITVTVFKNIMDVIDEKIKPLQEENQRLKKEVTVLKTKLGNMEKDIRKNNFILYEVEETETTAASLIYLVLKTLNYVCEKIGVKNFEKEEISDARRLGKKVENKVRPIVVSVTLLWRKMEIVKHKRFLPENVYLTEDFPIDVKTTKIY